MKALSRALACLVFLSATVAAAQNPYPKARPKARPQPICMIAVKTVSHAGVEDSRIFKIPSKSRKDCLKLAKPYRFNTNPAHVAKKEVRADWLW